MMSVLHCSHYSDWLSVTPLTLAGLVSVEVGDGNGDGDGDDDDGDDVRWCESVRTRVLRVSVTGDGCC